MASLSVSLNLSGNMSPSPEGQTHLDIQTIAHDPSCKRSQGLHLIVLEANTAAD